MSGHRAAASTFALAAVAFAGCGGGERQDAREKAASYTVDVTEAAFPARQRLATQAELRIAVKNTGAAPLADIAVTVDSFSRRSEQPGLADAERPVWVIDESPPGGTTAFASTWALKRLVSGETKRLAWKVTPIEAGRFTLKYTVAAGLEGKALARRAGSDGPVTGSFAVRISREPSAARVNPETGAVERLGK